MTIDRHFDDQAQAWEYADAEVTDIALLWILDHDFNLAAFDDWVEDPATTPARREQLLSMRQQAIDAQRRGDDAGAAGWVQTMRLTQQMIRRMGALLPLAVHGGQMNRGRKKGTVGKIHAWVIGYIGKHHDATAAQAWAALEKRPPRGVEVFSSGERHLWHATTKGRLPTGYRRFANLVSQAKKLL